MSPVALTNARNFSLRAERERLEREERERREREAKLRKMLDGEDDGDGGFAFSQVKVQELMTIAPIQQMQTTGL